MDVGASIAFVSDPPARGAMDLPPRDPARRFLDDTQLTAIGLTAASLTAAVLPTYLIVEERWGTDMAIAAAVAGWLVANVAIAWTLRARPRLAWRRNVAFPAWALVAVASAAVLSLSDAGATLGVDPLTPAATRITIGIAAIGVAIAAAGRIALSLSRRLCPALAGCVAPSRAGRAGGDRHLGDDRGARPRWTGDGDGAAQGGEPVAQTAKAAALLERRAADAVVEDLHKRDAVAPPDVNADLGRVGVFGGVHDRLRRAEVQRGLDVGREPLAELVDDVHGHRRPRGDFAERSGETVRGEQRWMDAMREVAQVPEAPLDMAVRQLKELGGLRRVAGQRPHPGAERHERADESLLRAVVEVALDASPGVVRRAHHPAPRVGELARDGRVGLGPARALLGAAAVGDVEDDAVEPFALVPLDGAASLEHPPVVARRGTDAVLELVRSVRLDRHPDLALDPPVVVRVHERHVRATAVLDEVRRRIPGDPLDLVADHVHRPVRVQIAPVDRTRDVAGERREQRRRIRRRERLRHGTRLDDPPLPMGTAPPLRCCPRR